MRVIRTVFEFEDGDDVNAILDRLNADEKENVSRKKNPTHVSHIPSHEGRSHFDEHDEYTKRRIYGLLNE